MEKKQSELIAADSAAHCITIEGRKHVRITGVLEVESFHEEEANILTQAGSLTVWGSHMKLGKLDPDNGQVLLDGEILSLEYEQPQSEKRFSLFSRK